MTGLVKRNRVASPHTIDFTSSGGTVESVVLLRPKFGSSNNGHKFEIVDAPEDVVKAVVEDLAGVSTDQTLADALAFFEGEGFILQSLMSGIVHLNPVWLAETVKPLADHRLREGADFIGELAAAMAAQGLCDDHDTAVDELSLFATNAQVSKTLLRALLTLEHAPTGHVNVPIFAFNPSAMVSGTGRSSTSSFRFLLSNVSAA